MSAKRSKKTQKTSNKLIIVSLLVIIFLTVIYIFMQFKGQNSNILGVASTKSIKPFIVSANIDYVQTVDVNGNNKMNLRVIDNSNYSNPTDTLKITISDIVFNTQLRDRQYNMAVFATCKTISKGLNWWGYPTRTWILTSIPVSQEIILVDFKEEIEKRLLDDSYPSQFRDYFRDFVNSGARCNFDLGLKAVKLGAASMTNYAWYPYVYNDYYSQYPLTNHPYSIEVLPENTY